MRDVQSDVQSDIQSDVSCVPVRPGAVSAFLKRSMRISDLMASLSQLTADGVARGIRKTAETPPRVSVIDVISAVTALDSSNASTVYTRLREQFPEVGTGCT